MDMIYKKTLDVLFERFAQEVIDYVNPDIPEIDFNDDEIYVVRMYDGMYQICVKLDDNRIVCADVVIGFDVIGGEDSVTMGNVRFR